MNAGLSSLATLKAHLLPPNLQAQSTWDDPILDLGKGVAAAFDRHCNRQFARLAGATHTTNADRTVLVLPRYPVETLTSVELEDDLTGGFTTETLADLVQNWEADTGLVHLVAQPGLTGAVLRFTYTGGYWWTTAEPNDDPEAQPSDSTALPADLKWAWLNQCRAIWASIDKQGSSIAQQAGIEDRINNFDFIPQVKATLGQYLRFS
jgi:hypothetical protein